MAVCANFKQEMQDKNGGTGQQRFWQWCGLRFMVFGGSANGVNLGYGETKLANGKNADSGSCGRLRSLQYAV
jgi:hypothetical protein